MGQPFSFFFDERLEVTRPLLHVEYESMPTEVRHQFELKCQQICATIPEKLKEWERRYLERFEALNQAEDEAEFDRLWEEMDRISSRIADLNLLYLHIEGKNLGANVFA
ncbi:hypothetical protein [Melghirimyces thermohalophilus]|nr:hypothetical protein [Melghirimyces thermohalophilus]